MSGQISRRGFIAVGAAGLLVGLDGTVKAAPAGPVTLSDWVQIGRDGTIRLYTSVQEMGQGAWCVHARILAEELDVAWDDVLVEQAPVRPVYGIFAPNYGTGGSASVREMFGKLRKAGATARTLLIQAAAQQWRVPVSACRSEGGHVVHAPSARRIAYGELAAAAANLPAPAEVALKPREAWTLIGSDAPRKDIPSKVDGSAQFAIDVHEPGMLTATLMQAPAFGGRLVSVDPAPALAVRGVRRVLEMKDVRIPVPGLSAPYALADAVVVVADGFWAARKGLAALAPKWDAAPEPLDTQALYDRLKAAGLSASQAAVRSRAFAPGEREALQEKTRRDMEAAFATADRVIEAQYVNPLVAHAQMEPLSAAARLNTDGTVEAWGGFQNASGLQRLGAAIAGAAPEKVTVHTLFSGGAFGRRYRNDFGAQAIWIAKAVGAPVRLIWTREEDTRQGLYRPASWMQLRAALTRDGAIAGVEVRGANNQANYVQAMIDHPPDHQIPYDLANLCAMGARLETAVPGGPWRSVLHTTNAFAVESFVDEIAAATGRDPLALRLELTANDARAQRVLRKAAEMANWSAPRDSGTGVGIALWRCFGSYCAQAIEVEVEGGNLRIKAIHCAADVGTAVHPDGVRAQAEGSIIMALSTALFSEINLSAGAVVEGNYDEFPVLRLAQTPAIHVALLDSPDAPLGGAGEPMTPPTMPALANAIYAASGRRIRKLPLVKEGLVLA